MGEIRTLCLLFLYLLCNAVSTRTSANGDTAPWDLESDEVYNNENMKRSKLDVLDIRMPNVSPQKPDTYYCTAIKMPEKDTYIVGYEPHAKMATAHHMLMFGCDDVSQFGTKDHWNCGEMGGTCSGQVNKIIYAWARDAPPLKLPKDVGFHVGGSGRIKYIVLQVHYANVDKFKHGDHKDRSGVTLNIQAKKPKYFAGIYLVAAGGPPIPPKIPIFHMDMACRYTVGPVIHPFAFRVHAHKLGEVVTGFRLRGNEWTMIGKGDPKRPQAFYKSAKDLSLRPGDILTARCTYNSLRREITTYIGPTGTDEMCNFYTMYYYDPAEGHSTDACETISIFDEEFPSYTDTLLPPAKNMDMKRNIESKEKLTVVENWPQHELSSGKNPVGQISGVATNTLGDVVIFHRGDRVWGIDTFDANNRLNPVFIKTPIKEDTVWFLKKETGNILRTWGEGIFHFPHGLTIDQYDNMWFTDVGMHQVFKFCSKGNLLLTLGEKFVPGDDFAHFCKPTDVAVETNGDFFVSDGYCNSRVIKFSAKGERLFIIDQHSLSRTPSFPPPANFLVPHSMSLHQNILYLADRENGRVLAFRSTSGEYSDSYAAFGEKVFAICSSKGGVLYVINGESYTQSTISGFTFELLTKKVIEEWRPTRGFVYPHDVTTDSSGNFVYVSEITRPGKIWKFEKTT